MQRLGHVLSYDPAATPTATAVQVRAANGAHPSPRITRRGVFLTRRVGHIIVLGIGR
jgi:hypothetical protein